MKIQYHLLFAMMLVMASAQSQAGRQGIHFLYGGGLSVVIPQVRSNIVSHDPVAAGEIVVGVEEDGWAAEYSGLRSLDAGTNNAAADYNVTISQVSLSYRTIERNGRYYKYKYGRMDQDINIVSSTGATIAGSSSNQTSGDVYGFAIGFRRNQTERWEIEYSYYSRNTENSAQPYLSGAHMISLHYIFGGAPYEGGGL